MWSNRKMVGNRRTSASLTLSPNRNLRHMQKHSVSSRHQENAVSNRFEVHYIYLPASAFCIFVFHLNSHEAYNFVLKVTTACVARGVNTSWSDCTIVSLQHVTPALQKTHCMTHVTQPVVAQCVDKEKVMHRLNRFKPALNCSEPAQHHR